MTSKAARHIELHKNLFANGFKTRLSLLSTSKARQIQLTSSLRKCMMALVSVLYVTLSYVACSTLLILPSWKHIMLVSAPISSTILLPWRHGLPWLLARLRIFWHLPLTQSVAWLQQCLIYQVQDASFFKISIIFSLLVLFDVLQFQWLLSFVLSHGIPFWRTVGGCLVCP